MIERSRTLFVGFIAFVLVLITFSSFQKNKQTEGLGSITCKNSPKPQNVDSRQGGVKIRRIYGDMPQKLAGTLEPNKRTCNWLLKKSKH